MTREEIKSRGEDEKMMDAPQINNNPKPEESFNVHYLRIYYGKSSQIFIFFFFFASQISLSLKYIYAFNYLQEICFLTLIFTNGFLTDTVPYFFLFVCFLLHKTLTYLESYTNNDIYK